MSIQSGPHFIFSTESGGHATTALSDEYWMKPDPLRPERSVNTNLRWRKSDGAEV